MQGERILNKNVLSKRNRGGVILNLSAAEFEQKYSLLHYNLEGSIVHEVDYSPFKVDMNQIRHWMKLSRIDYSEMDTFLNLIRISMGDKCKYIKKVSNELNNSEIVAMFDSHLPDLDKLYSVLEPGNIK